MVKSTPSSNLAHPKTPDYVKLLGFLVEPLLESPDSLSVDCEKINSTRRVWVRLAVDDMDKGRVYGRGGRNIQAIQMVLTMAANSVGQTLYLEIYQGLEQNSYSGYGRRYEPNRKFVRRRSRSRSQVTPKLSIRSRWQEE